MFPYGKIQITIPRILLVKCYNGILCACKILHILFALINTDNELGFKLLTAEFLCTMQTTYSEVTFRLFGKDFSVPWKQLSELLGFNAQCVVDIDSALQDFDRTKF